MLLYIGYLDIKNEACKERIAVIALQMNNTKLLTRTKIAKVRTLNVISNN